MPLLGVLYYKISRNLVLGYTLHPFTNSVKFGMKETTFSQLLHGVQAPLSNLNTGIGTCLAVILSLMKISENTLDT